MKNEFGDKLIPGLVFTMIDTGYVTAYVSSIGK